MSEPCPCGRGGSFGVLPYARCCGRFLDDPLTPAQDPESLMRSRYTAFARGEVAYLLATWDPQTRPERLSLDRRTTWTRLEVIAAPPPDGDTGTVTFAAHYLDGRGREGVQRERSRFRCYDGRWYYLDGSAP